MSSVPKPDKRPKYNQHEAFAWVDSQWEKFMTEQKEHKAIIKQLQKDLGTCTENFQIQRKQMEELVARVPSHYLTNTLKDIKEDKWIYEQNPTTGTLYRRKFGDYDNREEVDEAGNPITMFEQLNLFDNQTRK